MYIQTRVLEHYLVIGGVVLCFTPLFFSMFIPAVVMYVLLVLGLISFTISPKYLRFSSNSETGVLLGLITLCNVISFVAPHCFTVFPLAPLMFFIVIEIAIRNLLFEFMIRKGFHHTIPIIFVQVLYILCSLFFYNQFFALSVTTLFFLSISVIGSSVILFKKYSFWWQIFLAIVTVYGLFTYKVHQLFEMIVYFIFF